MVTAVVMAAVFVCAVRLLLADSCRSGDLTVRDSRRPIADCRSTVTKRYTATLRVN